MARLKTCAYNEPGSLGHLGMRTILYFFWLEGIF